MLKRDLDIICNSSVNWNMYKEKTILVTGSTGRLGMYIANTLNYLNSELDLNAKIVCLARNKSKAESVFGKEILNPYFQLIYQDVNEPIQYDDTIDYIFHSAGPASPVDYSTSPTNTLWTHVNGTHNVMECAKDHRTERVLYISTVEIYGNCPNDKEITEEEMGPLQHCNYRACYPESKRLCETMLTTYQKEFGISYCGVRMSHTLGPGISLTDGRGYAEFIYDVLNNKDIVLHSNGSVVRPYTYVADAVNAMFLIMDKGQDGFYNVAANENLLSIRELANLIASLSQTGKTKVVFADNGSQLPYLPYKLAVMDTTKVRTLGWVPRVDAKNVFKWTLDSFYNDNSTITSL